MQNKLQSVSLLPEDDSEGAAAALPALIRAAVTLVTSSSVAPNSRNFGEETVQIRAFLNDFRKDNCSSPPITQYVEARGIIEVSFKSL